MGSARDDGSSSKLSNDNTSNMASRDRSSTINKSVLTNIIPAINEGSWQ